MIIDCARRTDGPHPMDDEAWWLDLYVMLSRATKLDDLLLLRAPEPEFLLRGPPKGLQQQFKVFDKRVVDCRKKATERAKELGFDRFLRYRSERCSRRLGRTMFHASWPAPPLGLLASSVRTRPK